MSATVKLSKSQQDLLDAMAAGVQVRFTPYMGRFNPKDYYYRCDTQKKCTAAAQSLLEKGLVEKFEQTWRGHQLRIKE